MRKFDTGAIRNDDTEALDFIGFLSPLVLKRYAEYMHKHRKMKDGNLRSSDNWKNGIPKDSYLKSGFRHVFDWWIEHETKSGSRDGLEDAICAVIFNASGYLHEVLKTQPLEETHSVKVREVASNLDSIICSKCNQILRPGESIYRKDSTGSMLIFSHIRCPEQSNAIATSA